MTQILIIEDEPRIASFLEKGFKSEGFTVTIASTAKEALDWALQYPFALLILDLGLPDADGLEVLHDLRGQGVTAPIIILTARDDLDDKVMGLNLGADDYLGKPFSFQELLARVQARLRTFTPTVIPEPMCLKTQTLELDLKARRVRQGDVWLELPAREFILLETLLRHPDQVLSRQQLLDQVWGYDYDPGSNIVDVYIGYLRKKLGSDLIETVRGIGYRLRA